MKKSEMLSCLPREIVSTVAEELKLFPEKGDYDCTIMLNGNWVVFEGPSYQEALWSIQIPR